MCAADVHVTTNASERARAYAMVWHMRIQGRGAACEYRTIYERGSGSSTGGTGGTGLETGTRANTKIAHR